MPWNNAMNSMRENPEPSFTPRREAAFVLVPGAWCGAWCWTLVAPRLAAAGFRVYSLSLTGLADRRHLRPPSRWKRTSWTWSTWPDIRTSTT